MKWKIDDVPIFVAVVEKNGISAAATALGMPKSTVSTAISRLEHGLGLRLIERDSRNIRVTGEGEAFYRRCLRIVEQVREADAAMAGHTAVPAGLLKVALPPAFCQEILAPRLARFRALFPGVDLDLYITTHGIEMIRDQVDVAIVVGPLEDSELIARPLITGPLIWVSSPDYAPRVRDALGARDICQHVQICERRYGVSRLPVHIDGKAAHLDLSRGLTHVNDPLVVRRAVMSGAGISLLPRHYCREQLSDGSLIAVCTHVTFDLSASRLTAIYPSRQFMPPRVRVFLEFLQEICAQVSLPESDAAGVLPDQ
ncbi:MAG: LysR family transcriptional regulator [Pararhodobacter sp.]